MPARRSQDWIESFLAFTSDIPSPEIFRKWSAISAIAGCLQRRVWVQTAQSPVYANLYTLLVSPPGIGKSQAIARVGELWSSLGDTLHVAPNSVTRASLVDALDEAQVKIVMPDGAFQPFHALTVAASEFGVLVPAHDLEFLNTLNDIYDCPRSYRENRRSRSKQVDISFPMLNILGGTQPSYLASLLPEEAWGMGFTSRLIMIYSAQNIKVDLFSSRPMNEKDFKALTADLQTVMKIYGEMQFTKETQVILGEWYNKGMVPIPIHSRLQNYNTRRILHIIKLCMISCISRGNDLTIQPFDLQRAQDWLLEAEALMPDIFRDMQGKSDKQVVDDLHSFMWQMYAREQKPIHESRIIHFLQGKVPSEKILRIIELCERSGVLIRMAGTQPPSYRPATGDQINGIE